MGNRLAVWTRVLIAAAPKLILPAIAAGLLVLLGMLLVVTVGPLSDLTLGEKLSLFEVLVGAVAFGLVPVGLFLAIYEIRPSPSLSLQFQPSPVPIEIVNDEILVPMSWSVQNTGSIRCDGFHLRILVANGPDDRESMRLYGYWQSPKPRFATEVARRVDYPHPDPLEPGAYDWISGPELRIPASHTKEIGVVVTLTWPDMVQPIQRTWKLDPRSPFNSGLP